MNKKILFGTLALGLMIGSAFGFQAIRKTQPAAADTDSKIQLIEAKGKFVEAAQSTIDKGQASVRAFKHNPALSAGYQNTIWNPFYNVDPSGKLEAQALNFVDAEGWMYTVAADTGKVLQVGPVPKTSQSQNQPALDFTPRYTQDELKQYALNWLKDQGVNVDEATKGLEFSVTSKDDKGFFFRWTDKSSTDKMRILQVGFTVGGSLLSYTNTL